jgi:uncharacterized protein DUF929
MGVLRTPRALGLCATTMTLMSGLVIGRGFGPASAADSNGGSWQAAPTSIVLLVTHLPQSVFDSVGLQPDVAAPVILHDQRALTFDGKPGIFYEGAEPCPYCAAERWAFVIALARFGSWSDLGIDQSAADDIDPSTQTFTFSRVKYSSPYVAVVTREILSNRKLPDGDYAPLQQPTPEEARLDSEYTSARYFPVNPGYLPFLDFGNRVVISQSSYDPSVLHELSREQIASDLSDPTNPVTLDIVATANYLSAATCLIDGNRPTNVCQSPGVRRSTHFVKASYGFGPTSCNISKNGQSICGGTQPSKS